MVRTGKLFLLALAVGMVSCREAEVAGPAIDSGFDRVNAPSSSVRGLPAPVTAPASAMPAGADDALDYPADDVIPVLDSVARYTAGGPGNAAQLAAVWIGPEGGTIRLNDFEVVVPPGAVDRDMRFVIRILPEPARDAHAWASFSPHNHRFNVPVTLRVPFRATESAGSTDAHVLWWNDTTWVELPTTQTEDGRLETQTDHFSMYATQRRGITMVGG